MGRAVLLRKGKIVGDVSMLELEERGGDLMGYVKETYRYQADRVSRALEKLAEDGEEEQP